MDTASPPHNIPDTEPHYYEAGVLLEEESFPWYSRDEWYPVRIGEVFESKYQVLLKLGYGSVSTVWLCRDLHGHRYVTLKVYMTGHRQALNEVPVLSHLDSIQHPEHPGSDLIRRMLDSFELSGVAGPHTCIVHQPHSLSMGQLRECAGGKIPSKILKPLIYGLLLGLDYLHSEAGIIHTDIQEDNVLFSIPDLSILDDVVKEELENPSPRKIDGDRTVYSSVKQGIPDDPGVPTICDLGDAKFGQGPWAEEVMPDLYRAPEIILKIPWSEKIDIWGFGLMVWDLIEGKHLFTERLPSREESSAAHLARMVSLLGPPPRDLLERSNVAGTFFNDDGSLKDKERATVSSLADEDIALEGDEKSLVLAFLAKMLQWRPEDRASAEELLQDGWVTSFRELGEEEGAFECSDRAIESQGTTG